MSKGQSQIMLYKESAEAKAIELKRAAAKKAVEVKDCTTLLLASPRFQTVTISTAAGTVLLGGVGGAFGTASGVLVGGATGVIPAIFTFGLSIPTGAVVGGGAGLCVGTAGGACAGALGGATSSYAVYSYRVEIKNGLIYVKGKANTTAECARLKLEDTKRKVRAGAISTNHSLALRVEAAKTRASSTLSAARARSILAKDKVVEVVSDPDFKKVSAAAAGGAVAGGTTGAATGTVVGGTIGAAVGVVPALFTFGLSIPICAAIGGGAGFCTGAAGGATVGATGGAASYKCYQKREEIDRCARDSCAKLSDMVSNVGSKAKEEASRVKSSIIKSTSGCA